MATTRDLVTNLIVRDQASRELAKASQAAKKSKSAFADLKREVVGFIGVAVGLDFARQSVREFGVAEQATQKLADAYARFPALAQVQMSAFQDLNKELQKTTVFDDDATTAAQALLAQFQLTGRQIYTLTPLVQDLAARLGVDVTEAATVFGKALLGNSKGLKGLGIEFKATGDRAADAARLQQILNDKVGGFAEKQGKTAAGQAQILSNQFGELKESIGKSLMPVVSRLVDLLGAALDVFAKLPDGMQTAVVGVALVGGAFVALKGPIMGAVGAVQALRAAMTAASFANPIVAAIGLVAAALGGYFIAQQNAQRAAEEFATTFDKLGQKTDATAAKIVESLQFNVNADDWKALADIGLGIDVAAAAVYKGGPALENYKNQLRELGEKNVNLRGVAIGAGNAVGFAAKDMAAGAEAARQSASAMDALGAAAKDAASDLGLTAAQARTSTVYMRDLAAATGEAHRELARLYDKPVTKPEDRTAIQQQVDADAAAARARRAQEAADAAAEAARRRQEARAEAARRRQEAADAAKAARDQAIATASSFASGIAASIASYGKLALLTDKLADARGRLTDANDRLKASTADAAEARRTLAQLAGDTSPQAAEARAAAERKLAEAQAASAKAAKDKAKAAADEAAAKPTAKNILADVRRRLGNIRAFANAITRLKKLGLNNTMLQDLINAGPEEGLLLARAMESAGFVKEANALQRQINVQAARVGAVGAESQFGGPGPQVRIAINLDGKTVQTALVSLKRAQGGVLNF